MSQAAMERSSSSQNVENNNGFLTPFYRWVKASPEKLWNKIVEAARKTKKLGQDDPRRIFHSIKVASAVTVVSLFYYFKPLFDGFGVSAIWAVLTVVQVFEFSAGATVGKGTNRMLATLVGGALALRAHHLATLAGKTGEGICIASFVLVITAGVTFMRFFPKMRARYDFGLMVFILTFCLVCVSGYRDDEVLDMAKKRLSTIIIGSCTSIIMSVCVCPVWIGEDLHNRVAVNMERIGNFLEGFGSEYFRVCEDGQSNEEKSFLEVYKSVLASKESEENMANLAIWEPRHGRFKFRHPWKQYLKVGALTRQCAYKIEALNGYLTSNVQTPLEMRRRLQEPCMKISSECGNALKKLSLKTKKMRQPTLHDLHIANAQVASENLKSLLRTEWWEGDFIEVIPAAAVASLLLEIIDCTEKISEAVQELATIAQFKKDQTNLFHRGTVQLKPNLDAQNHVVNIGE